MCGDSTLNGFHHQKVIKAAPQKCVINEDYHQALDGNLPT